MDEDFLKKAKLYIAIAAGLAIGIICVYNVVDFLLTKKGPGTIFLKVRDTDKEPVSDAAIHIEEENGALVTNSSTDADGEYEQDNLPPGKYSIKVSKDDFETATVFFKIKGGRTKKLKIKLHPSPLSPLEEFGIKQPLSTK